ncbi:aminodeoxychorismate lyase [mine drainage metagenome]|uniref:aminodeoxychorismate lyase n=1 Tax=mine drainage metagenome TaxID=410659 RepID=A0A1J5R670_9ZZZZ
MLINGAPGSSINAEDRGLSYGDGVFRTLRMQGGRPVCWERQYAKLQQDCSALKISCPSALVLFSELQQLGKTQSEGVAKIIITRGVSSRGYAPSAQSETTRILSVSPIAAYPADYARQGVRLYVCKLRLGHQPLLAGIKHLNRLENVLASSEWQGQDVQEGLLNDVSGNVIGGTRSNLFMLRGKILYTPNLSRCGVAGVQRARVMDWAKQHGVACSVADIRMEELMLADEIFLVNSVFGLWPVCELAGYRRTEHPGAWKIREWLNDERH